MELITKITVVKRPSTGIPHYFYMEDNWLKVGDVVYNQRTSTIHEVGYARDSLVEFSNSSYIREGDRLQVIK